MYKVLFGKEFSRKECTAMDNLRVCQIEPQEKEVLIRCLDKSEGPVWTL